MGDPFALGTQLGPSDAKATSPQPEPMVLPPRPAPQPGTHRLTARAPGQPPPRPAMAFDDAHEVILAVSTDTGVAMLLAMPNDQAARKMPVEAAAPLTKAMPAQRATEILGYIQPAVVAALLAAPDGLDSGILQQLKPTFREQVMR